MKARIHFTTANGQETYADFNAPLVKVLNESAKQQLLECFWFEFGELAVDGIEEIN